MAEKPPISAAPYRFARTELALAIAIALLSILIGAYVLAFRATDPAEMRTLSSIELARTIRNETLALSESITHAEIARGNLLAGLPAWEERQAARASAREHIDHLQTAAANDGEMMAIIGRLAAIVETAFAREDADLRAGRPDRDQDLHEEREAAIAELIAIVNHRNDAARQREERLNDQMVAIGVALAVLSLMASGLSILALRRERYHWALANSVAETARARAAASDLAKTRFLAAASHDMRQPLHALTLYLAALNRRVNEGETRAILANADRAAQSLVSMFAVLLDLARIEANVLTPEFANVSVAAMFEQVAAEHPGGNVIIAPTNAYVRSDPALLQRILSNLVSNALRHGGGQARLSANIGDSHVDIQVADSGPGIAKEDQARVFEEFVRLDGKHAGEGLGLGLAIVRRLARLLRHDLKLASQPGRGAIFELRAPRSQADEAHTPEPAALTALTGAEAVVIDDDPLARDALAQTLTDFGLNVRTCANEDEVAKTLDGEARLRLAIIDLNLGGRILGFELAEKLAAQGGEDLRIVLVTGDTGAETLASLRASGRPWLIKPIDADALAAVIANA